MPYHNVCRLCLNTESIEKVDISSKIGVAQNLAEKIATLMHTQLPTRDDNLPHLICKQCIKELDQFYSFYQKSIASMKILKDFLERIKLNNKKIDSEEVINKKVNLRKIEANDVLLKSFIKQTETVDMNNKNADDELILIEHKAQEPTITPQSRGDLSLGQKQCIYMQQRRYSNSNCNQIIPTHKTSPIIIINNQIVKLKPIDNCTNQKLSQTNASISSEALSSNKDDKSNKAPLKKYTCEVCNRSFQRREYLYQHRKIHKPDSKKFKCRECNAHFLRKEHLNRHNLIHTGERNNICTICHKRFTRRDNLAKHILIHSQGKFPCTCGKKFHFKHHLAKHQQLYQH